MSIDSLIQSHYQILVELSDSITRRSVLKEFRKIQNELYESYDLSDSHERILNTWLNMALSEPNVNKDFIRSLFHVATNYVD